jgi:hypothetical protein
MPKYRPPSNNRLLALEQELLGKKRLAEARQRRQDITYFKKNKTTIAGDRDLRICPLNPPCKTAKQTLFPPRIGQGCFILAKQKAYTSYYLATFDLL